MFWLKSCPKCHGDLHDVQEVGERYISCLQCGRVVTDASLKAQVLESNLRPLNGTRPRQPVGQKAA
jgi:transcription initiation factor TFIIIB Brf1 subunit/transcription initiation factor TFIIB